MSVKDMIVRGNFAQLDKKWGPSQPGEIGYTPDAPVDNRKVAITKIARDVLSVESLEARDSDDLDFSEQAAWTLRQALEDAYDAGRQAPRDAEWIWIDIGIRATRNSDGSGWDLLCGEDKARDVSGIRASQIMYAYCDECMDALQSVIDQAEPNVGDDRDKLDSEDESERYSGTPEHRYR